MKAARLRTLAVSLAPFVAHAAGATTPAADPRAPAGAGSFSAAADAGAQATGSASDVAAARALFEANLDAIRRGDRDAYLACYLEADTLARNGPSGPQLGFEGLARTAGEAWPDRFEGTDLQLVPVRPGVVYGTYRYRVRYGTDEQSGISERVFLKTEAGWRIAMTSAFPAPPRTPPPPRALAGATLVDGTGAAPVADAVVVLRAGKVDCAGSRTACPVPDGVEIVDVSGHWIVPGLVDAHVHFSQTGWADGRPDALDVRAEHPYEEVVARLRTEPERFFRAYLCSGVTAVFDNGGYPWTWSQRARAESDTRAPHVAAAGPLLSTRDFWLNLPGERQFIYLEDEVAARDGVAYLAAQDTNAVKVWFLNVPQQPFAERAALLRLVGAEARRAGKPLIVHATELQGAKAAVEAGAHLLVHSVVDAPVDAAFLEAARAAGTLYCPTLTVYEGYGRLYQAALDGVVPEIDDPNRCVDADTLSRISETSGLGARVDRERYERRLAAWPEQQRLMADNLRRVRAAGIPVVMGTDAGNPLTLAGPSVYAELEAMQAAGLTPMDVIVAATRNGARAMGREPELGTIEKGKAADLVVVAADPTLDVAHLRQVRYVVRGGELRPVDELRAR